MEDWQRNRDLLRKLQTLLRAEAPEQIPARIEELHLDIAARDAEIAVLQDLIDARASARHP